jgi:lysine 2,3-aminomutase
VRVGEGVHRGSRRSIRRRSCTVSCWAATSGGRSRRIKDIDEATFLDHKWQSKHTIIKPERLLDVVQELVTPGFIATRARGFTRAPMALRVSPYLLSLIDWSRTRTRIRCAGSSSRWARAAAGPPEAGPRLAARAGGRAGAGADAPLPGQGAVPGARHLPGVLPVLHAQLRGRHDTDQVEKVSLKPTTERWEQAFAYIASRPELEDIVISGGDSYNLRAEQITTIGNRLLDMPNVRRMRFATKGPAVMPQKILTDDAWFRALVGVVERGRKLHKEVVLHTHFNHPNELTAITSARWTGCSRRGDVRNQSVLQRGVNDAVPEAMRLLIKRMSYLNVHAYYVYVHDLVKGVEDLRTTVGTAIELEKQVRGLTAGFNTPTFVVDAPGGGGKRDVHSFEHYNRRPGSACTAAPTSRRRSQRARGVLLLLRPDRARGPAATGGLSGRLS